MHTNCYLVINNHECVVIDPASDAETIVEFAQKNDAEIKAVILTHGHFDHVGACKELQKLGIKIYASKFDGEVLKTDPKKFGLRKSMFFCPDYFLEDGQNLTVAGLNFKCLLTSGHTDGSMSFLTNDCLFCGDTIFAGGSYGRCDLFSGSYEKLKHSIKNVIFPLGDDIKLFCGHGQSSIIKTEKALLTDF